MIKKDNMLISFTRLRRFWLRRYFQDIDTLPLLRVSWTYLNLNSIRISVWLIVGCEFCSDSLIRINTAEKTIMLYTSIRRHKYCVSHRRRFHIFCRFYRCCFSRARWGNLLLYRRTKKKRLLVKSWTRVDEELESLELLVGDWTYSCSVE